MVDIIHGLLNINILNESVVLFLFSFYYECCMNNATKLVLRFFFSSSSYFFHAILRYSPRTEHRIMLINFYIFFLHSFHWDDDSHFGSYLIIFTKWKSKRKNCSSNWINKKNVFLLLAKLMSALMSLLHLFYIALMFNKIFRIVWTQH